MVSRYGEKIVIIYRVIRYVSGGFQAKSNVPQRILVFAEIEFCDDIGFS